MTDSRFHFQLGDWSFTALQDGAALVPAAGFFGETQLAEVTPELDRFGLASGDLPFSINLLLATNGHEQILVDTGVGKDVGQGEGRLLPLLQACAVEPGQITAVIITHGHWDHIGGLTDETGALLFSRARHFMPASEWAFWTNAETLGGQPDIYRQWAEENLPPLADRIELIAADALILPGVTAVPAAGHTVGQIGLRFQGDGADLLHISDAAHHPLQVAYPQLTPEVDTLPDASRKTRQRLLTQAAADQALVFAYHFPFPGLGHVVTMVDGWVWQPLAK